MLPLNRLLEIASVLQSKGASLRYGRESKDTPSVNAFCCVAPRVRERLRDLSYRCFLTSKSLQFFANIVFVHERRFATLAISTPNFSCA